MYTEDDPCIQDYMYVGGLLISRKPIIRYSTSESINVLISSKVLYYSTRTTSQLSLHVVVLLL